MAQSTSRRHPSVRALGALGIAAVTTAVALSGLPGAPGPAPAVADPTPAPASLLRPAVTADLPDPPASVVGSHRLVTLDAAALPTETADADPAVDEQRLRLPVAGGEDAVVRLDDVDAASDHTTWTGTLEGEPLSSFTLVEVGSTLRGSLVSPAGVYALTPADDGRYWWTLADPAGGVLHNDSRVVGRDSGPDTATSTTGGGEGAGAGAAGGAVGGAAPYAALAAGQRQRKGKAKIGILFGYTKAAKAEAGGKASLKAAARLIVAQTNEAFSNSGIKAKLRYRGLAKTRGKETGNPIKNAFLVARPRDGRFDNLQQVRRRKSADLVQLLTTGDPTKTCGGGLVPYRPGTANAALGASSMFLGCLPYLVATHEIAHNLGADHNKYPGVTHVARTKGSYGFANPAGGYITVMSYYEPCSDNGIFTCVRVPYFSSPKNTYGGQPLGTGKSTDNSRVIKQFVQRVARYLR